MAIIKCPECSHHVSDKAPVCPNCGVEIAGKIIQCPFCGETYFKNESICPHCHKGPTNNAIIQMNDNEKSNNQKNNKTTLIVSIIIAFFAIGLCLYFYINAQNNKEREEYEFAMNSEDPAVLQAYLNNFKDAPQAHTDSITAHLQRLRQIDQDWTNAVVSGSKAALEDYISKHPDSSHKQEALNKIDSIDWMLCIKENSVEEYQTYISIHPDGLHYEEAVTALEKIKANEVSSDERLAISGIFHNFFVSINSKNENNLTTNIGEQINFLGRQNATREDIVEFMYKLYKNDVESMIWSLPGTYDIQKREIGDKQYEYNTTFMAKQEVNKKDGTKAVNQFRINAKIDPDGKITEMSMTRIIE